MCDSAWYWGALDRGRIGVHRGSTDACTVYCLPQAKLTVTGLRSELLLTSHSYLMVTNALLMMTIKMCYIMRTQLMKHLTVQHVTLSVYMNDLHECFMALNMILLIELMLNFYIVPQNEVLQIQCLKMYVKYVYMDTV